MKNKHFSPSPKQCRGEINNSTINSGLLTEWSKESYCADYSKYTPEDEEDLDYLLTEIKKNPEVVFLITPRRFEQLVCYMLRGKNRDVILTQQTHDGGKDIILIRHEFDGDDVTYYECKQYRSDRLVDVGIVRELSGVVEGDKVNKGVIVTTSDFTEDAKTEAKKHGTRMTLMRFSELLSNLIEITPN